MTMSSEIPKPVPTAPPSIPTVINASKRKINSSQRETGFYHTEMKTSRNVKTMTKNRLI